MTVLPRSPFLPIPFGNGTLPGRRGCVREGCGWARLCPSGLRYDRFEFEVRTQDWYAPFLANTEHLMQTLAMDVAGGDNQVRDRLRFDDSTQVSHSATNGHAIDSPAL